MRSRSSSVVAGTMRSTMVEGQATSPADEGAEFAVAQARRSGSTTRFTTRPLDGRLSQVSTREGRRAGRAAALQRLDDQARRGARGLAVGEVVHDVGMRLVQRAGRRVVAIALLGDRQRHDPHARVGHGREQRARRPPARPAPRVTLPITRSRSPSPERTRHGVEAVLRGERVARVGASETRADDAPAGVARRAYRR